MWVGTPLTVAGEYNVSLWHNTIVDHLRHDPHGFVQTPGTTAFVECLDDDPWVRADTRPLPSHLLLPPSRHRSSRFASHQSTLRLASPNPRTTRRGVASRRFGWSVVL